MEKMQHPTGKFMGSVKVGPKGQIVIPKEIRSMFQIESGDTLIVLADSEKGIAIERMKVFDQIADAILSGKARELYPEHEEDESIRFASEIKKIIKEDDHDGD